MNRQIIKSSIKEFEFKKIFNELGWDNHTQELEIQLNGCTFQLRSVAIKKEFVAFVCLPDGNGREPDYQIRKKLETKVTPFAFEHIIIFYDQKKSVQIWQWVKRESGKPTATRETKFYSYQDPELLVQKLVNIEISLDDEESLGITDIRTKTKKAFDVEKITKEFYTRFKKEHDVFQNFIEGITEEIDKDWYSSLMLNRLMFIYFIQKKHFLNNDPHYLRTKLNEVQHAQGKDKFHSFYNSFLLVLFHKGLGSPERTSNLNKLLGKIPYLNGGLFDVHQLEYKYDKIDIPDKAFEKIFDFFDQYEWHLDTRIKAKGNEINPDVIGYIFEKYINDRASMGAYYTKEDITDYISKMCIIPFLFDETIRNYKANAFEGAFAMLKNNPDKYIYDAVRHGANTEISISDYHDYDKNWKNDKIENILAENLPDDIACGIKTVSKRTEWNKQAPPEFALPTEIWREVVERHRRYYEIKNRILSGQINSSNDFITYNLNIRQFMQDVIENTDDPFLLKELYKAIKKITILDPTCGSGAFLFAALNILEPLYEACIQRMQNFVDDSKLIAKEKNDDKSVKFKFFEDEIKLIHAPEHTNEKYFIYKSIILNNLHGVDIMKEAVEIAKLRLFLKLVGTVEADQTKNNLGLEPLPDIDFNIRAGNTLIGFVNIEDIENYTKGTFKKSIEDIKEEAEYVNMAYKTFQKAAIENDNSIKDFKEKLGKKLDDLNEKLDIILAKQYRIDSTNSKVLKNWKETHQPFHWLSEFYQIISENYGFDVIIGNPPYVEYSTSKFSYRIDDTQYLTYPSRNLYSYVFERAKRLQKKGSRIGLIVQISSIATPNMESMVNEIKRNSINNWISNYATRPSYLFDGVTMNLTIILSEIFKSMNNKPNIYSSHYLRWNPDCRQFLFDKISLKKVDTNQLLFNFSIPKIKSEIDNKLLSKISLQKNKLMCYLAESHSTTNQEIFYRTAGGRYFKVFIDKDFGSDSKSNKSKYFKEEYNVYALISLLSSNLWWWYYTLHFDMYNCKDYMIFNFLFDYSNCKQIDELINIGKKLTKSLIDTSESKFQNYATTGDRKQIIFKPSLSKSLMDEIDYLLAEHYGFTDEELDFIINYDIKYRMGKELEEEE